MRITIERLKAVHVCEPQVKLFSEVYPDGVDPTVENLFDAVSHGLDAWWTYNLLPNEGPGSKRAYALWCAEQVAHLNTDERVASCLAVVRRRVEDPVSVSDSELAAAAYAARSAAGSAAVAAGDAAWAAMISSAVGDAAGDAVVAAWDAEREAQLVCLSQMLLEAE